MGVFKREINTTEGDMKIIRYGKPKTLDLLLGIVFFVLTISSFNGMYRSFADNGGTLFVVSGIFNLVMGIIGGVLAFTFLLKDKFGYIKLGKNKICVNYFLKEKVILSKNIIKIVPVAQKDIITAYRIICKGSIHEIPLDYYKDSDKEEIIEYFTIKSKLLKA